MWLCKAGASPSAPSQASLPLRTDTHTHLGQDSLWLNGLHTQPMLALETHVAPVVTPA